MLHQRVLRFRRAGVDKVGVGVEDVDVLDPAHARTQLVGVGLRGLAGGLLGLVLLLGLAIGEAGAANAGLLAAAILATSDDALAKRLQDFRATQTAGVAERPS